MYSCGIVVSLCLTKHKMANRNEEEGWRIGVRDQKNPIVVDNVDHFASLRFGMLDVEELSCQN
eukprot:scaffold108_cov162-Amphora_coffeaeformis.AAC.13